MLFIRLTKPHFYQNTECSRVIPYADLTPVNPEYHPETGEDTTVVVVIGETPTLNNNIFSNRHLVNWDDDGVDNICDTQIAFDDLPPF